MVKPKINYTVKTLAGNIKKARKNKGLEKKGKSTILTKPKAKLPSYDPTKILMKGTGNQLVREGRTKYFNEEYREETKWLG